GLRPDVRRRRHRVADLLSDQRPRERREDRDPPTGRLRLVGADDLVAVFLAALVLEEHRRAERDALARRRRVDDLGPSDLRLELRAPPPPAALPLAPGVVLRALREVAVGARL